MASTVSVYGHRRRVRLAVGMLMALSAACQVGCRQGAAPQSRGAVPLARQQPGVEWRFSPAVGAGHDAKIGGVWIVPGGVITSWLETPTVSGPGHDVRNSYGLALLDAGNGRARWRIQTDDAVCRSAVTGGREFFAALWGIQGGVWRVDTRGGRVSWQSQVPMLAARAPALDAQHVYCLAFPESRESSTVTALARDSGLTAWQHKAQGEGLGVAAGHHLVYVSFRDGPLLALKAADGSREWSAGQIACAGAPVVAEADVLVGARDGVHCFDAQTGEEIWSADIPAGRVVGVTSTLGHEVAYVADADSALHALRLATGARLWSGNLPVHVATWSQSWFALRPDGTVVCALTSGEPTRPRVALFVLAPSTGLATSVGEIEGATARGIAADESRVYVVLGDRWVAAVRD